MMMILVKRVFFLGADSGYHHEWQVPITEVL